MAESLKDLNHVITSLQNISVTDIYNGKMTVNEYTDAIEPLLKAFIEIMKVKQNREQLGSSEWNLCEKIVRTVTYLISDEELLYPNLLDVCADVFRCLRNAAAGVPGNQRAIMSSSIFNDAVKIIKYLTLFYCDECSGNEEVIISLRCGIQLLGNLASQDNTTKDIIWEILYTDLQIFRKLLASHDHKIQVYTSMVLYNCLTPQHRVKVINDDCDILKDLIDLTGKEEAEWSLFVIEEFLLDETFWQKCYNSFKANERLLLLDIIAQMLERPDSKCPEEVIVEISNCFKLKVSDIIKTDLHNPENMEPFEIQALLLVLCKAAVFSEYNKLKADKELLETALDVLRTVHLLGKVENGPFSPVENFIDSDEAQKSIESSPCYGFRRDLIRLIGNLCADCVENQTLVREMDGIPLLLDCCRIDMRNPFISEWSILAIRNLLHGNLENQEIVAGITIHGDIVESDLLKQLRLRADKRNGKVVLVSLDLEEDFPS